VPATGGLFFTVVESVATALSAVPSLPFTSTVIVSPLSPKPGWERSSVLPVWPASTTPFFFQT
jgi:hypothetical protein